MLFRHEGQSAGGRDHDLLAREGRRRGLEVQSQVGGGKVLRQINALLSSTFRDLARDGWRAMRTFG